MHSPTRIRLHGKDMTVTGHSSAPGGKYRLHCEFPELQGQEIELWEGDSRLTMAAISVASVELLIDPATEF